MLRTQVRRILDVAPKLGLRYRCPFCHLRFRRLEARGRDLPVYAELGIVGGGLREAECPWCRSNDRERLLYLVPAAATELFSVAAPRPPRRPGGPAAPRDRAEAARLRDHGPSDAGRRLPVRPRRDPQA